MPVIILLLFVFSMVGCEKPTEIRDWPPIDGQVLDEQTDTPVAGAHVIALYDGVAAWTTSVCFHVENATTDEHGRFRIPAWTNTGMYRTIEDQSFSIYAYKPGYRKSDRTYKEQSYKMGIYYVKADKSIGEERLNYLWTAIRPCGVAAETKSNLLPLYRAVYEETKSATQTEQDRKALDAMLYEIEVIEYGYEAATKRRSARAKDAK